MKNLKFLFTLLFILITFSSISFAGSIKESLPGPAGAKGIALYYRHISGNSFYLAGDRKENFNYSVNGTIVKPFYYFDIGPIRTLVDLNIPFGSMTVDGSFIGNQSSTSSGLGDPLLSAAFWLYNDMKSKTFFGFLQGIYFPIGEYDNTSTANLGAHCWRFKSLLGFTKGFGNFLVEILPQVFFYTDNDEYGINELKEEKEPLFLFETHLSYDFNESFYAGLSYMYNYGGKSTVNGVDLDNKQNNHALQLAFGFNISPALSLLIEFQDDFYVEYGPKTDHFGGRLLYAF